MYKGKTGCIKLAKKQHEERYLVDYMNFGPEDLEKFGFLNENDDEELVEAIFEGPLIKNKDIGFSIDDFCDTYYENDATGMRMIIIKFKGKYIVANVPALFSEFEGVAEYPSNVFDTYNEAEAYYDSCKYCYGTVREEYKKIHKELNDMSFYIDLCSIQSFKVYTRHDILLCEYLPMFTKENITELITEYKTFEGKLEENGIKILSIDKERSECGDNQRYYSYEVMYNKQYHVWKEHIPARLEHRFRKTYDLFNTESFLSSFE